MKAKPKQEPPSLTAEVERVKKSREKREIIAAEKKAAQEQVQPIDSAVSAMMKGFRVVSEEEAAKHDAIFKEEWEIRKTEGRAKDWESICPPRYREPFDQRKVNPDVDREALNQVLTWTYSDRGLYIVGESGHSKTRAVFHALKHEYIEKRRWVKAIGGEMFGIQAGAAFKEPEKTEKWLQPFLKCDILFLDDMAKRWTPSTEEAAFAIIEHRSSHLLPIIVTINNSGGDLAAISTDQNVVGPLIRRLQEFCELVIL